MAARKLRTWVTVRCPACGHSARVGLQIGTAPKDEDGFALPPKLKCSRCGHRDPIIAGREPLRQWSRYRR